MTRKDDGTLTPDQFANVRRHADRLLREASAYNRFPTPISDLVSAAKLIVVDDELLDERMLQRFLRKARGGAAAGMAMIKSALSKVLGLFEAHERLIIIDKNLPSPRVPFVKLHETGHGYMPHQQGLYALTQDCEKTLDPFTTDLFEREANVFASEALFQGKTFADFAHNQDFSLKAPMSLATKFGASNYSAFRRYVDTSPHVCCVVVLEQPVFCLDGSFTAEVRRIVVSKSFQAQYNAAALFSVVTHNHPIGPAVPRAGRRMTRPREAVLVNRNGERRLCTAEAFDTKHQVLVLVRDIAPYKTVVALPPATRGLIFPSRRLIRR